MRGGGTGRIPGTPKVCIVQYSLGTTAMIINENAAEPTEEG